MPKAVGILFCGGGTGGHVLPGLAVAASLREDGETSIRWIGDPARLEATLVPAAGIDLLPCGLSRPRIHDPRWLCHAARTVWQCARELTLRPPQVVVALGGYAALVPGLLAPILRRPLVVMEQNAHAGRTNRLLAKGANAVVTQFPEASRRLPWRRVHDLGNPVRAIAALPRGTAPRLRVVIMGGSLAAKSINDVMLAAASQLAGLSALHLIHLAGKEDQARCTQAWQQAGATVVDTGADAETVATATVEVHGFWQDMPGLYNRTDIALCRSGATSVAELCVAGIGALYMPLPWAAEDHQTANAQAIVRIGGAIMVAQKTTTAADLVGYIRLFIARRDQVAELGRRAHQRARPQAAAAVANLVRICGQQRSDSQRRLTKYASRQAYRAERVAGAR